MQRKGKGPEIESEVNNVHRGRERKGKRILELPLFTFSVVILFFFGFFFNEKENKETKKGNTIQRKKARKICKQVKKKDINRKSCKEIKIEITK